MKDIDTVYKVVKKINGRYFSCRVWQHRSRKHIRAIEYTIGYTIVAPSDTLGIFCFGNIDFAKDFMKQYPSPKETILEVTSVGPWKKPTIIDRNHHMPSYDPDKWAPSYIPLGTLCFPIVKVVKEI